MILVLFISTVEPKRHDILMHLNGEFGFCVP